MVPAIERCSSDFYAGFLRASFDIRGDVLAGDETGPAIRYIDSREEDVSAVQRMLLRFGIVSLAPQGQDIRFQEDRIEGGKNFCNKLWNACRFRQMSGEAGDNSSQAAILARLEAKKFDAAGPLDQVRGCHQRQTGMRPPQVPRPDLEMCRQR